VFPTKNAVAFATTFAPTEIVVLFTVEIPVTTLTGLTLTDAVELATLTCVLITDALTVLLPTNNVVALAITFAPTATAVVLTVEMPAVTLIGDTLTDAVEFATLTCVLITEALTVLFPTRIAVVFATTFAPTAIAVVFTIETPVVSPIGVINALDVAFDTVTFPATLAEPTTESAASGEAVLIPIRLESPFATSKLVLTTKPFLTTKSLSAITVPFPLLWLFYFYL
jgi:hypothetical protein